MVPLLDTPTHCAILDVVGHKLRHHKEFKMKLTEVLSKVWLVVSWPFKQLWMLVSDYEKDFDPWKLLGTLSFVFAAWIAKQLVAHAFATGIAYGTLGVLGGLVTAFITVGTFLFSQSHKMDSLLAAKSTQTSKPADTTVGTGPVV